MQLPMFGTDSSWRAPSLSDLPDWSGAKRVGFDTETCDPFLKTLGPSVRRGGFIAGFSFAIEDGPSFYLPIRHKGGDNLPVENVLRYMRDQAAKFDGELVGTNLAYDLDFCAQEGVEFGAVRYFRDITIADPLIYELHMSYSLENISQRLGLEGKDETLLRIAAQEHGLDPKSDLWQLPARYVGPYATQDAELPLRVLRAQERRIDDLDLWQIYNLESRVLPILVKMRRRGVRIDTAQLDRVEDWALQEETKALALVRSQTGVQIKVGDVWKAGTIAPALEAIGVNLGKTSKGQYNIDKSVLGSVDHPVAQALAHARKVNKLRTTFAASVREHMVRGRIHCTFKQIAAEDEDGEMKGARFGRLSCVDPNLQQQPSRDEFANMWRAIYIPEEGAEWACLDYSQQEPRWTTHFAAVCGFPKAAEAAQAYHDDPKIDNHQFMADLTGLKRKFAKNIYLGLCYGEGGAKLCRECGFPTRWALASGRGRDRKVEYFETRQDAMDRRREVGDGFVFEAAGEEGQRVIDQFDMRAPFIRQLAKYAENTAKQRGYIITKGGRRLHFPQREDGSYDWTHKALNRVIQGTSADQVKAALVALDAEDHYLQLQVHDEVDLSVWDRQRARDAAQIMREVVPASVPFRVDVEVGPSWGQIELME